MREGKGSEGLADKLYTVQHDILSKGENKSITYTTTTRPKPHKISRHLIQTFEEKRPLTPTPLPRSFSNPRDRGDLVDKFPAQGTRTLRSFSNPRDRGDLFDQFPTLHTFKVPVHYFPEFRKKPILDFLSASIGKLDSQFPVSHPFPRILLKRFKVYSGSGNC